MLRKAVISAILAIFILGLSLSACGNEPDIIDPVSPIYLEFSFPQGFPLLNKSKEFKCTVRTSDRAADNVEIMMDLPDGLELAGGSLLAKFPTMATNDEKILIADVKPVEYGDYGIDIKYSCGSKYSYKGQCAIYLSVADGPTWLTLFQVHRGALYDIYDNPYIQLSLTKAPALNEITDLSCTLMPSYHAVGTEVKITSLRRLEPEEGDVYPPFVEGARFTKNFELEADKIVSFSTKVRFKELGKWEIRVEALGYIADWDKQTWGENSIYFTVFRHRGEMGWTFKPTVPLPQPPPITTPTPTDIPTNN